MFSLHERPLTYQLINASSPRTYKSSLVFGLSLHLHLVFKKASGILQWPPSVCLSVRPSVCPSRYLLLNHWTKFNQIWCVSCSHEWGVQRHIFFGPAPWGPWEGPKGQISLNIIKFQLLSQFQRFLNQTLCVFSQMEDIKHIRWDFHLASWVMPQGWDLGVLWGVADSKKKFLQNSTRFGV